MLADFLELCGCRLWHLLWPLCCPAQSPRLAPRQQRGVSGQCLGNLLQSRCVAHTVMTWLSSEWDILVNSLVTNNQNEAQIPSASHSFSSLFFTHWRPSPAERGQESPQIKKDYRWYHKLETQLNTKYSRWNRRNFRRRKESQTKLRTSRQTSETKLWRSTSETFLRQAKTLQAQTQLQYQTQQSPTQTPQLQQPQTPETWTRTCQTGWKTSVWSQ